MAGKEPDRKQWKMLRSELSRLSGITIFIGGQKVEDAKVVDADGVFAEFESATQSGSFLLPIGATGGTSRRIAERLLDPRNTPHVHQPTKNELRDLMEPKSADALVKAAMAIVRRVAEG